MLIPISLYITPTFFTLCHHGTTIWFPWEIFRSYSSSRSDRYLQDVADFKTTKVIRTHKDNKYVN